MYETSLCCCIGNHVKPLESFQIYFDVLRVTNNAKKTWGHVGPRQVNILDMDH